MAQNVTVAGARFSDVPAVSLPKTGGGTASFYDTTIASDAAAAGDIASGKKAYVNGSLVTGTAAGGNVFLVTVSYNSNTDKWEPDCTYSQVQSAYSAGKTITVQVDPSNQWQMSADGNWDSESALLFYFVRSKNNNTLFEWIYTLTSNGLTAYEDGERFIQPSGTIPITSNGSVDVTNYATANVNVSGGGGNDFIVTLTWNNSTQLWEPDCTIYELQAAYADGKSIAFECADGSAVNWFCDDEYVFVFDVYSWDGNSLKLNSYVFTVNGVEDVGYTETIVPVFDSPTRTYTPTESQQTETITFDPSSYNGIQQVGVTVNPVSSSYVGSGVTRRTSTDLGANGATVTAPAGYYENAATKTITSGSVTAPASITGTSATVSTGTNTLTLSKTVSVTPNVTTAGYIASGGGTAGNSNVSLTASVTTQAAQTIYPSSSDQTISSGRYLTGAQTIKGVTTANLTAENIKSGVTVTVGDSADADRILSVTGTYSGGGGSSKNVQVAQSTSRATSSTYTNVISLTCNTAGTYDIYWDCFRSSTSGTSGSQLYIGGNASGNANTTFTNHVQTNHRTGVTLAANQTVAVYARSRGNNYYAYVGTLTIVQTA